MNSQPLTELLVWTIDGYEGRFLQWDGNCWRAYEHRNYRHWCSDPQAPNANDIQALREKFQVAVGALQDSELVRTSPAELARFSTI